MLSIQLKKLIDFYFDWKTIQKKQTQKAINIKTKAKPSGMLDWSVAENMSE